ncbi:MAG: histidine kinase, partial [Crocinitomicaceae bacterium]
IERFYQLDDQVIGLHESKGFRLFSIENNTLHASETLFPNSFISTMYSDSHGTLFLGTFGEGILVVPQTNSLQYYTNSLISDFDVLPDNTVYLSTREGKVLQFKDGIFTEEFKQKTNIDLLIASPFLYDFSTRPFFTDVVPNLTGFGRTKDAFATPTGIYVATNNGIYFIANNSDRISLPSHFKSIPDAPNFVYNIYGDRRFNVITVNETTETIYFANDEHLFMMGKDGKASKIYFKGKGIRCTDATMWEGQLLVATPNQGILFFKEGVFQKGIRFSENGLISDNVEKIIIKKDELFIQTDKGIQIIQLKTGEMKFLGFKEGLTTNLISDFSVSHDKLWIQEKHKIYAIDLNDISHQEQAVSFEIDSVLISGKTPVSGTNFDLAYDDKSLHIFLNYRDILRIGEAYFEYRITGEEWQRIPAKQGVLELNNLSTGSYGLEIRLHYRNEISATKNLHFSITPPIWMRWWFYPLILLALSGCLILFYRRKLRKQAAHARHMNELNTSKMTALQSQMNPHFIFNALNSIQHLVMRGNKEEAYKYITQFANLVRRTLDYSEQETIPIKDEIDLLKVYLNLEKLRFKDEFDFEFVLTELRDVRIPPMLIQPFIENALLHGLLHKEGKKHLKLILEMKENTLHCWVEDNGIGRAEAKRIRQRQRGDHKSFALNALDNRFRILRESYHADIGYSYEDLSPKNELDCVTRVHLKIPTHS